MKNFQLACRQLRKHPGFSAIVIATLALGIGANTAIFSVVNAVLLRPLEYPDAGQLVTLRESNPPRFADFSTSPALYLAAAGQADALQSISLHGGVNFTYLPARGEPLRVRGMVVTPSWFKVLGIAPARGQVLRGDHLGASDDDASIVISHGFWQRQFGGAEDTLGRTITLDGVSQKIVGIMPPNFERGSAVDIWAPHNVPELMKQSPFGHWLQSTARLKPGATLEQLQAQLESIDRSLLAEHPVEREGWHSRAYGKLHYLTQNVRTELRTMFLACGLLLILACINVAGLLLVRTISRAHELAIRAAIGANGAQLARVVLSESLLLALLGAAAGIPLAFGLTRFLVALDADALPRGAEVAIDGPVLAFALLGAIVSGLVAGVLPALAASRVNLEGGLRAATAGMGTRAVKSRVRFALVAGQVALATVLLASAGLLVRSFATLRSVHPGFDPDHATTVNISLPYNVYGGGKQENFIRQLDDQLRAQPGVGAAGMAQILPIAGDWSEEIFVEGRAASVAHEKLPVNLFLCSPGWHPALGIPLRAGRLFTPADAAGHPVCVVSESFVSKYLGGGNPLGRRVGTKRSGDQIDYREIVGVVGDIKVYGLDRTSLPQYYEPLKSTPSYSLSLVARGEGGPDSLGKSLRRAVLAVDSTMATSRARTLAEIIDDSVERRRVSAQIIAAFALSALVIAALGVYGAITFNVAVRSREFGIRLALGAAPGRLRQHVFSGGLKLVAAGLLIGLPIAVLTARALRSQLFEIGPADPMTYLGITLVLGLVAALAAWLPARRASKVDPLVALRAE